MQAVPRICVYYCGGSFSYFANGWNTYFVTSRDVWTYSPFGSTKIFQKIRSRTRYTRAEDPAPGYFRKRRSKRESGWSFYDVVARHTSLANGVPLRQSLLICSLFFAFRDYFGSNGCDIWTQQAQTRQNQPLTHFFRKALQLPFNT